MTETRKLVKSGLDYIRDKRWNPVKWTISQCMRYGNKKAIRTSPECFWHVCIADCGAYYRISLAGQPDFLT